MHIGSCSSDAVDSMASLPSGCTPTPSLPVGRGGMKVKCSGWYEAGWDVLGDEDESRNGTLEAWHFVPTRRAELP